VRITGRVEVVYKDKYGRVLRIIRGKNLVVSTGKALAASILSSSSSRPSHMALGSGTTAPAESQTALVAEIAGSRATFTSNTVNGNELTYRRVFTNSSGGTWNVGEIGIFNAGAGGTMFSRFLLTPVTNVANTEVLDVTWTLPIG